MEKPKINVLNKNKGSFYKPVETGLYYLNSRYYNPEIGRFINADGLIGQTGEFLDIIYMHIVRIIQ